MKVVVEIVSKFICVMKTKFLSLENFPFHIQQADLKVFIRIHLLLSGTISAEVLIKRYFGTIETQLLEVSSQFEHSL